MNAGKSEREGARTDSCLKPIGSARPPFWPADLFPRVSAFLSHRSYQNSQDTFKMTQKNILASFTARYFEMTDFEIHPTCEAVLAQCRTCQITGCGLGSDVNWEIHGVRASRSSSGGGLALLEVQVCGCETFTTNIPSCQASLVSGAPRRREGPSLTYHACLLAQQQA